ncbi:CoA-binding protein [Halobacillus kuroshimensis]|uniref:CoA-binding protein n=1 Tax=Halobacillus kuroshimensis TaxID=302481 RepID=A0ABS3DTK6_9BACI|nr:MULTISPECIES: CoA-binding protein [Halobacillus]MBN8234563.1 CoA-binding protein [Halobacillus kuroshimensis]
MPFENPSPEEIKNVLKESKTIAVVGLSDKPHRTSYQISEAMQAAGYKIIPVNPTITEVLGEPAAASLQEIEEPVDIVNVFRRSEYLPGVAEEARSLGAKAFWAQQGVYHEEAWEHLKDTPAKVIMDFCIKVAHSLYR